MGKFKHAAKPAMSTPNPDRESIVDMVPQPPAISKHEPLSTAPNNLWYRLHALVFDLRHFRDRDESVARLNTVVDPMYIGAPYFSVEEAEIIKSTDVDGTPLAEVIERTMKEKLKRKKRTEAKDFRPCAAHDLAPLLERAFDIKHKKLDKSKHFNELLKNSGLELKDNQKFKGV
jgi:hypothetical protein